MFSCDKFTTNYLEPSDPSDPLTLLLLSLRNELTLSMIIPNLDNYGTKFFNQLIWSRKTLSLHNYRAKEKCMLQYCCKDMATKGVHNNDCVRTISLKALRNGS